MQDFIEAENENGLIRDYDKMLTDYVKALYDGGLSKQDCLELGRIVIKLIKIKKIFEEKLEKVRKEFRMMEAYSIESQRIWTKIYSLDFQSVINVKKIRLLELEANIKDLDKLIWDYENIYQLLNKEMRPSGIGEFIRRETSLNHLVYTNNKENNLIKLAAVSSFKYLCPFHSERTPSFFVNESTNSAFCYGCGINVDAINYLRKYENISVKKAISLLAQVYLLNIGKRKSIVSSDLVDKYRSVLISDEYYTLVIQGYERACGYEDSVVRERAVLKFEKDVETIERVRRGEYIKYKQDDGRKLVLKRPDFDENI